MDPTRFEADYVPHSPLVAVTSNISDKQFSGLKILHVKYCQKLVELFDDKTAQLPNLQSLHLRLLPAVKGNFMRRTISKYFDHGPWHTAPCCDIFLIETLLFGQIFKALKSDFATTRVSRVEFRMAN